MIDFISVRSEAQIANVAILAREIWNEHYVPFIGQAQVDYMLEKFQSECVIAEQLIDSYEYFILVYNGKSAGYLAIIPDESESTLMISNKRVRTLSWSGTKDARGC